MQEKTVEGLFDLTGTHHLPDDIGVGSVVKCGPVGAVWVIVKTDYHEDGTWLTLTRFHPNDVPLGAAVYELPLPLHRSTHFTVAV